MPRRPASKPLRADAARNRAAILAVAEALLAEEGVTMSTEEVARRASVGVGTVFRHFPTKEALLRALAENKLARMADAARAVEVDDEGGALFRFFEHAVAQAARKGALVHALTREGVDVDAWMSEAGADFRAAVGELLERAQAARVVRPDVELADVLDLLIGLAHASERRGAPTQALGVVVDGLRFRGKSG